MATKQMNPNFTQFFTKMFEKLFFKKYAKKLVLKNWDVKRLGK